MNREKILGTAAEAVLGSREKTHGSPTDSFAVIANLWSAFLRARRHPDQLATSDVAAMMILFKMGRIALNPSHEDSWVDSAGYSACGGELATEVTMGMGTSCNTASEPQTAREPLLSIKRFESFVEYLAKANAQLSWHQWVIINRVREIMAHKGELLQSDIVFVNEMMSNITA